MIKLKLPHESGGYFGITKDVYAALKEETEEFLKGEEFLNSHEFARKVMLTHEIKANNTLEGIRDDITLIQSVINDASKVKDEKQRRQIINLYEGYKYVLSHDDITEESLNELYRILSNGLLSPRDLSRMGKYYREDDVYILFNGRIDNTMDKGVAPSLIEELVQSYLNFINEPFNEECMTDYFIKSCIMHFYLEYIHPYFDVNSRTTRTVALWYLMKNACYPFIIFNRGITLDKTAYERMLVDTKKSKDISYFIRYMLARTKRELEKEYLIHQIAESSPKLSVLDYQTLAYFLEMKGEANVLSFTSLFNFYNTHKRPKELYETMIDPLIQKGVLVVERTTGKSMFESKPNEVICISKERYTPGEQKNQTTLHWKIISYKYLKKITHFSQFYNIIKSWKEKVINNKIKNNY